jgi:hypothetical protein
LCLRLRDMKTWVSFTFIFTLWFVKFLAVSQTSWESILFTCVSYRHRHVCKSLHENENVTDFFTNNFFVSSHIAITTASFCKGNCVDWNSVVILLLLLLLLLFCNQFIKLFCITFLFFFCFHTIFFFINRTSFL